MPLALQFARSQRQNHTDSCTITRKGHGKRKQHALLHDSQVHPAQLQECSARQHEAGVGMRRDPHEFDDEDGVRRQQDAQSSGEQDQK